MANEIVKYNNKLNNFNYGRFSAVEADIFFSLVSKIRDEDGVLSISFDELKEVSNYYSRDEKRFIKDLDRTFTKYLDLKYREEKEDYIRITNVFSQLLIAKEHRMVLVQVTPGMEWLVYSLNENFTRFELAEFTQLKGSYAKSLYRLLKQWRHHGDKMPMLTVDEFKFKLDIPANYRQYDIDRRVIDPSINELTEKGCFKNLKCEKQYQKSASGKGRPKVVGYKFSFDSESKFKELQDSKKEEPTQEGIAKVTGWRKTQFYCPDCHEPIFCKEFENENGPYTMYAHTDFRTGKCRYKTYDTADLLRIEHIQDIKVKEEPVTEEQIANKSRLANMLSKMFSKGE